MAQVPYGITTNGAHISVSPSNTGNGTAAAAPAGAKGFLCTVSTANAYMTLDGSVPSATNGLTLVSGGQPFFFPGARSATFLAASPGSVINILWLS